MLMLQHVSFFYTCTYFRDVSKIFQQKLWKERRVDWQQ